MTDFQNKSKMNKILTSAVDPNKVYLRVILNSHIILSMLICNTWYCGFLLKPLLLELTLAAAMTTLSPILWPLSV